MRPRGLFHIAPILCIEITDRCNMACPMCITLPHRDNASSILSPEVIKADLLRPFRFAGGRQVVITGGEPTISEYLPDILEYAVYLRLKVFLATNLYRVDPCLVRRVLGVLSDSEHAVMVSYDSVYPAEMAAIRGVDAHRDVTANLISLLEMKESLGVKTKLCASLVLQKENSGSVAETIEFLLSLRLHRVFVQPINVYDEIDINNYRSVGVTYGSEELPNLFEAIEDLFRLAENEPRIKIPDHDMGRWKRHFTCPTENCGSCKSTGFIFVDPFGNYRGCNHSKVYANLRDIGLVDFPSSRMYEKHRELAANCRICLHSSS
jgi:MoaA/NifB/PqqE/SkfB family radical SAM enzyme